MIDLLRLKVALFASEVDNYISFDFSIEITAPHK